MGSIPRHSTIDHRKPPWNRGADSRPALSATRHTSCRDVLRRRDQIHEALLPRPVAVVADPALPADDSAHNGKEENFQPFMALLDGDRFEGRFRDGVHTADVSDLMRRMVKENLVKFDATPLFPERIAHTVPYQAVGRRSCSLKAETGVRFPSGAPVFSSTWLISRAFRAALLQLFSNT